MSSQMLVQLGDCHSLNESRHHEDQNQPIIDTISLLDKELQKHRHV